MEKSKERFKVLMMVGKGFTPAQQAWPALVLEAHAQLQVNPLTGVETKWLRVYPMNVFCGRHGMSITMLILTLVLMMMLLLMVALNFF